MTFSKHHPTWVTCFKHRDGRVSLTVFLGPDRFRWFV